MHKDTPVAAIAAVARNGIVGKDGQLPWRIPGDLKYFRRRTKNHAVVMGRRTLDEIQSPLKRRMNVVLSRSLQRHEPNLAVARSLEEALDIAQAHEQAQVAAGKLEQPEIMVIGGPQVWAQAWPKVDRFYLTRVLADFEGDTRFPDVDLSDFKEVSVTPGEAEAGGVPHEFVVLQRRGG